MKSKKEKKEKNLSDKKNKKEKKDKKETKKNLPKITGKPAANCRVQQKLAELAHIRRR